MDRNFLRAQDHLRLNLKEGYRFWEDNADLVTRRFADPSKKTTVLIVHPDSEAMPLVAAMDPLKLIPGLPPTAGQRSDCLETVRILQMIHGIVRTNGSRAATDTFHDRVQFVGHHYVPSWNGGVGDETAIINVYPTGPAPRGPMLSNTVKGEIWEHYKRNLEDILNAFRDEPKNRLFEYRVPDNHTDLRVKPDDRPERTRRLSADLLKLTL